MFCRLVRPSDSRTNNPITPCAHILYARHCYAEVACGIPYTGRTYKRLIEDDSSGSISFFNACENDSRMPSFERSTSTTGRPFRILKTNRIHVNTIHTRRRWQANCRISSADMLYVCSRNIRSACDLRGCTHFCPTVVFIAYTGTGFINLCPYRSPAYSSNRKLNFCTNDKKKTNYDERAT